MNRLATDFGTGAVPARVRARFVAAAAVVSAVLLVLALPSSATAAPQLEVSLENQVSEAQQVVLRAGSGQFRLRFGQGGPGVAETVDLPYNPSAAQVQSALNALSNISQGGGSVSVTSAPTGSPGETVYRVAFDSGPLAGTNVPQLVGTNGTTPLSSPFPGESLAVETVELAGVRRGDERLNYVVQVRNNAPAGSVPSVGDSLGCADFEPNWTPGTASGFHPVVDVVEWWRNGVPIPGATGAIYTTTAADAGMAIQCVVRGSNAVGVAVFPSLPGVVVNPQPGTLPPAPSNRTVAGSRPTLGGGALGTRTCSTASMNWTAGTSYALQWLRNGVEIPGATGSSYVPQFAATGTGAATSGSNQITGVTTSTGAFAVGQRISGSSGSSQLPFPPGTTITSIDGNTLTVSANATANGALSLSAGGDAATVLQCRVVGSNAGGAIVGTSNSSAVGVASNPVLAAPSNPLVDSGLTAGTVSLVVDLPMGANGPLTRFTAPNSGVGSSPAGWSCTGVAASGSDPAKAVCTRSDRLSPQQSYPPIEIWVNIDADATDTFAASATVSGGGSPASLAATDSFDIMAGPALPFGLMPESADTYLVDDAVGTDSTQAGGHAWGAGARVGLNLKRQVAKPVPFARFGPAGGLVKRLRTDTPPGLVGNATAPVLCESARSLASPPVTCPPESFVGEGRFKWGQGNAAVGDLWTRYSLVAIEPERGVAAQFAFADPATRGVYILNARLRPEEGYAVTIDTAPIASQVSPLALGATICSYGANVNDPSGIPRFASCKQPGDPGAFEKPLLTNPTSCTQEPPMTRMSADSWENPGVFASLEVEEPLMEGCNLVPFTPTVSMSPTSDTADGPSGFDASIDVPVDGFEDPDGISQSHLKKTVVELPEGVSVNPSAATGLEGCTDGQLGLKTDSEPTCPDGSKLGTVSATTPALEETLSGVMVLRTPKSTVPQSGEMLRVALIVRNDERGILVKLPGFATADPDTGRLVATFDDNPQLPIGHVEVHLRGGDKGVLAMGQDCGEVSTEAGLTPWSRPNTRVVNDTTTDVDQRCENGFAPKLSAGSSDNQARGQGGTYSFKFSREDGEQWLRGLTAKLPKGLLASVKDVPLCSNGLADAGNCPASSKIGVVDAKAGSGDPFVLEEKGEVFLTEGYKGGEYGLAVKIRPVAGPFRGQYELSPIIVRQAIHVDRTTAEVTAVSDPFPLIHHGIPLRAREVNVLVNSGGFMVNPSDCDRKQSAATLVSDEGTTASFTDPFQVSGCSGLAFKPTLAMALTGKRQVTTGKHPGIKAVVTQQGTSEAGIEKAVVRLPKSLALDPNNAQALCEFADGTKPDLENHCPAGSIVGRARAKTPLLKDDLVGNVYFVKNVRKDPETGNEIRTLPMIVVALRGEIAINLKGESDTTKSGKLVNTFNAVPDAPISQFNLNVKGGNAGIIAVTRTRKAKINLCAGRHVAESDMDGHNGRRHDTDVRMKTPCTKRQVKNAKRAAAKAGRS